LINYCKNIHETIEIQDQRLQLRNSQRKDNLKLSVEIVQKNTVSKIISDDKLFDNSLYV